MDWLGLDGSSRGVGLTAAANQSSPDHLSRFTLKKIDHRTQFCVFSVILLFFFKSQLRASNLSYFSCSLSLRTFDKSNEIKNRDSDDAQVLFFN